MTTPTEWFWASPEGWPDHFRDDPLPVDWTPDLGWPIPDVDSLPWIPLSDVVLDPEWTVPPPYQLPEKLRYTAPPGWPVPEGWQPSAEFRPPRDWPRAPAHWRYWQPDTEILAINRARLAEHERGLRRVWVATSIRCAGWLNSTEAELLRLPFLWSDLSEIDPLAALTNSVLGQSSEPVEELRQAVTHLRGLLTLIRDEMFRALREGVLPDDVTTHDLEKVQGWRDHVELRYQELRHAQWLLMAPRVSRHHRALEQMQYQQRTSDVLDAWRVRPDITWTQKFLEEFWVKRSADRSAGAGAEEPNSVDWQLAEEVAAQHLRDLGYADVATTRKGSDGGLDVEGRLIAGQVKYISSRVGRPMVQQLVGAAPSRIRAFYSRSGFTRQASEYAATHGVALFTVSLPSDVDAVNEVAEDLELGR